MIYHTGIIIYTYTSPRIRRFFGKKRHLFGTLTVLCYWALVFYPPPLRAADFHSPELEKAGRELQDNNPSLEIYSEDLSYSNKTKIYTAKSFVEIRYGKFHLKADRATFNSRTGEVLAEGNVVIDEEESRLTGDRIKMNVKTKQGEIENGTGFITPHYYFSGKKIVREAENIYTFEEGSYTACDQEIPDWRLEAKKGRIQIENYATFHHVYFYANRVPILYFPYTVFPIRTKRSSGFLLPEMGTSDRTGFFVRNFFFWAPLDWLDFTLNGDYYTKLGIGGGGELRAALSKEDRLEISNFFLREENTKDERWEVDGDLNHTLPLEFKGMGEMNLTSDKDFYRDYSHRNTKDLGWKKASQEEKWRDEQRSFYSLNRNWGRLNLNNTVEYTRDISNNFMEADQQLLNYESTIWKYPEFSLSAPAQPVPYTPFYFQMESSYLNYEKRTVFDYPESIDKTVLRNDRFDIHPEISLPWSPVSYLTLTPRAGARETWWKKDKQKTNHNRDIYELGFLLEGPEFFRVFEVPKENFVSKYKHLVRPAVDYKFIPSSDQKSILQFDAVDYIEPAEEVEFSLTQQLLQKTENDAMTSDVFDLVNFVISETFDIREARRHHDLGIKKAEPWSPVKFELEVRLADNLYIDSDIEYNIHHLQVDSRNYSVRITDPQQWYLSAGHRWKRTRTYYYPGQERSTFSNNFQGNAGINFWKKMALSGSGIYNFEDDLWIEQEYALEWLSQCWSFKMNYLRNYTAEADPTEEGNFIIEREDVFYFTLNLYSLDTFNF